MNVSEGFGKYFFYKRKKSKTKLLSLDGQHVEDITDITKESNRWGYDNTQKTIEKVGEQLTKYLKDPSCW